MLGATHYELQEESTNTVIASFPGPGATPITFLETGLSPGSTTCRHVVAFSFPDSAATMDVCVTTTGGGVGPAFNAAIQSIRDAESHGLIQPNFADQIVRDLTAARDAGLEGDVVTGVDKTEKALDSLIKFQDAKVSRSVVVDFQVRATSLFTLLLDAGRLPKKKTCMLVPGVIKGLNPAPAAGSDTIQDLNEKIIYPGVDGAALVLPWRTLTRRFTAGLVVAQADIFVEAFGNGGDTGGTLEIGVKADLTIDSAGAANGSVYLPRVVVKSNDTGAETTLTFASGNMGYEVGGANPPPRITSDQGTISINVGPGFYKKGITITVMSTVNYTGGVNPDTDMEIKVTDVTCKFKKP